MPEQEFDLYLSLLSRLLRLSPEQKAAIDNELRDHLEARFEELVRKGVPRDEAIQWALDEFGDAAGLAQEFTKLSRRNIRRWIMRCTLATAAMGAVVLLVVNAFLPGHRGVPVAQNVVAQDNTAAPEDSSAPAVDEGDVVRIDPAEFLPTQLSQPIELELIDVPLRDAMQLISERIGAPVFLDRTHLVDAGLSDETEVRETANGEPVYVLLDRMFRSVGGYELGWYWEDGILHVTTREAEEEVLFPVSYNIRDLLEGGYEAENLVQTIQDSTEGPWQDLDGIGGSMQRFGDLLAVRQTQFLQCEVGALLKALRTSGRERRVLAPEIDDRLDAQLNQVVTVDFKETPLRDVVRTLNDSWHASLQLDEQTLQDAGVGLDSEVTLTLSGQPLRVALKYLFKNLGGMNCTAVVHDGRVIVTTRELAEEMLETIVYDVTDIVQGDKQLSEDLADLVINQTEGSWVELDGIGGVISVPVPDLLVIRQTQPMQRAVRELLAQPRRAMADAKSHGKPVDFEASLPDKVETRYYTMDADTAEDLLMVLPEVIAPGTWAFTSVDVEGKPIQLNADGIGSIRKVSAGHKVLHLGGEQAGQFGGGTAAQPAPEAGSGKSEVMVVPQAVLIISHKRSVHRQIREFLQKLSEGSTTGGGGGPGMRGRGVSPGFMGSGFGGGGFLGGMGAGGGGFGGGGGGFFSAPTSK